MLRVIVAALLFLSTCCFSQNIQFSLSLPVRTIGADEYAPVHYQFRSPQSIFKMNDHYFVTDYPAHEIRMFDSDWNYVRSIGGLGQGPGEYMRIGSINHSHTGNVLVYDVRNRVLTKYAGSFDDPVSMQMFNINYINELADNQYLVYKLAGNRALTNLLPDDHVLGIYNSHFDRPVATMGAIETFWDFSQPFMRTQPYSPPFSLRFHVADERLFFAVPYLYSGKIALFRENAGNWDVEMIQGHTEYARPYRLLNMDISQLFDENGHATIRNFYIGHVPGGDKRLIAQRLHTSKGIFRLASGELAHFSYKRRKDDLLILQIEVFDKGGTFKGWGELDIDKAGVPIINEILMIDEQNRLYTSGAAESGAAVIRVMQLEFH